LSWDMGKCMWLFRDLLCEAELTSCHSFDSKGSLRDGLRRTGCHRLIDCRFGFHVKQPSTGV
jgi:hypothetical protein